MSENLLETALSSGLPEELKPMEKYSVQRWSLTQMGAVLSAALALERNSAEESPRADIRCLFGIIFN